PSSFSADVREFVRVSAAVGGYYDYLIPEVSYGTFLFQVFGDGKLLFESDRMKCSSPWESFDLDISDIDKIEFKSNVTDHKNQLDAYWGDLTFYRADGTFITVGEAENTCPFSFDYNGVSSKEFLKDWTREWSQKDNIFSVSYTDPKTFLKVTLDIYSYPKYNVFWQKLYFENVGDCITGQISNVRFVDMNLTTSTDVYVTYANGSDATQFDFMNFTEELNSNIHLGTYGGRSSSKNLPYFDIEDNGKVYIGAVGWSGEWIGDISKNHKGANINFGLENFDAYLNSKEKIMVGGFALMDFDGTNEDAHNLWRRWMYEYNTPKISAYSPFSQNNKENEDKVAECGQAKVPLCYVPWGSTHEDVHCKFMDIMERENLKFDYYWIDAGWYGNIEGLSATCFDIGWGNETGNWYANPGAYPSGMDYISRKIHEKGMKEVMWIEPVRARRGTQIVREHPEHFFTLHKDKDNPQADFILNLSNDKTCDFCIDFLDEKIKSYGIDCYEEDFNINPKAYWDQTDAENPKRRGIAEVKFVTNHWRFWDTIKERNPYLFIINCASGGRKLDIETVGRGIAMWRTDYGCYVNYDHSAIQTHSMNLLPWVTLHSAGIKTKNGDLYDFRSSLTAGSLFLRLVDEFDYDFERKILNEFHSLQKYFYGDYYTINKGGLDKTMWNAYQMSLPETGEGAVFAYRHEESPISEIEVCLKGVKTGVSYFVTDLDTDESFDVIGGESFFIKCTEKRQAKIFTYKENK
ncbi:MAG: alpha-galactosidase, partial [Armatimonadetes bacterium]|nr:alpha-galactosidase [Candidatus Hippobium faecium]